MSKIYRALEKAQREREKGSKEELDYLVGKEEELEEGKEREKPELSPVLVSGHDSRQGIVSLSQPASLAAEQFRKLRARLLRFRISDPPKTVMVTSSTSGEGKTLVSINLAAGIAHDLHAHALLVECDLRHPNLCQWFDLENGKEGLGDYLRNEQISFSQLLIQTEMEKLKLVLGGSVQDKPAELISSKKMERLVHELRSRYPDRYIIFDSTPLLATTEPEILSKFVDGIIVVVRAGVTPRETLKQAMARLEKEKILGFVLNDLTFKSSGLYSRYFGSNGYYYRYGYGTRSVKDQRGPKKKNWPFYLHK
jgi:exopolysaccharide/PEP-CTERM locus tyrosine autokinase